MAADGKLNNNALRDWHFRKDLSIGNIITSIIIVVGLVAWGQRMEGRVNTSKELMDIHVDLDTHPEQQRRNMRQAVATGALRVRLDHLVESNKTIVLELRAIRVALNNYNRRPFRDEDER